MVEIDDIQGKDTVRMDESAVYRPSSWSKDNGGAMWVLVDGETVDSDEASTLQFVPEELGLGPGEHIVQFRISDYPNGASYTQETKEFTVVSGECACHCECTCGGCCRHGD